MEHITDSSNETDTFVRNRLRHHVMPLLRAENPKLAENLSAMALRLRQDEEALSHYASGVPLSVISLRQEMPAVRARILERFLKESDVREPEAQHISLAESLISSDNPSARGNFPGGITISRNYDTLEVLTQQAQSALRPVCTPAEEIINTPEIFTVVPVGTVRIRPRQAGDSIRLHGGSKSLKKLFIDRKIPAAQRDSVPVI